MYRTHSDVGKGGDSKQYSHLYNVKNDS
jgi:hypothetical protein